MAFDISSMDARQLGVYLRVGDSRAIKAVRMAFVQANGSQRGAAAILGVHEVTLARWVTLPSLKDIPRQGTAGGSAAGAAARSRKSAERRESKKSASRSKKSSSTP